MQRQPGVLGGLLAADRPGSEHDERVQRPPRRLGQGADAGHLPLEVLLHDRDSHLFWSLTVRRSASNVDTTRF